MKCVGHTIVVNDVPTKPDRSIFDRFDCLRIFDVSLSELAHMFNLRKPVKVRPGISDLRFCTPQWDDGRVKNGDRWIVTASFTHNGERWNHAWHKRTPEGAVKAAVGWATSSKPFRPPRMAGF